MSAPAVVLWPVGSAGLALAVVCLAAVGIGIVMAELHAGHFTFFPASSGFALNDFPQVQETRMPLGNGVSTDAGAAFGMVSDPPHAGQATVLPAKFGCAANDFPQAQVT
jgi:hypothetical protein